MPVSPFTDPFQSAEVQATDQRRRDIRARMLADIAKDNPMMGSFALNDIVDHAMFYCEHLLAEIEALRQAEHDRYEDDRSRD